MLLFINIFIFAWKNWQIHAVVKIVYIYGWFFRNPHRGDLPEWPEYTAEDREYVEFHSPSEFTVRDTLREKYCAFWNRVNADAMANP